MGTAGGLGVNSVLTGELWAQMLQLQRDLGGTQDGMSFRAILLPLKSKSTRPAHSGARVGY